MAGIGLKAEEDGMRAYIFGTVAHEVAHRCEAQMSRGDFEEYHLIIKEETVPQRSKFVSDYVLRHSEVYGSNEQILFKEDFAEAVRIYTTNPDYLKTNYPRRFDFIEQNFPFIKPGGVIDAISKL